MRLLETPKLHGLSRVVLFGNNIYIYIYIYQYTVIGQKRITKNKYFKSRVIFAACEMNGHGRISTSCENDSQ